MTKFAIVDMFADRPCAGSGLAVFPDATSMNEKQMRALAREMRQPETTFALPPEDPDADYCVRVFTPDGETPFSGHSSLGTAATLVRLGFLQAGRVVQQCGSRLTELQATRSGGRVIARTPLPCTAPAENDLCLMAGLPQTALSGEPVRACGFGPLFHFLPVQPEAVAKSAVPQAPELPDVVVFAWDPGSATAHARVFAPGYGMDEDPACTSAALGMALWLTGTGALTGDGTHTYQIRQGLELDRPSTMDCTVTMRDGQVVEATAGGAVVPVADGDLVTRP